MTRRGQVWTNVRGSIVSDDETELEINFLSSGFQDPGCTYGPPENCYPPEGDDERSMESVKMYIYAGPVRHEIELTDDQQNKIFDLFEKEVQDAELDDWDEGPYED